MTDDVAVLLKDDREMTPRTDYLLVPPLWRIRLFGTRDLRVREGREE